MPISLSAWESFYVITGSSGAALTGLMFVVIALVADRANNVSHDGLGAFSTPTVTHFSIVLLLAGIMTMPVHSATSLRLCLGAVAIGGLVSAGAAVRRMKRLSSYTADPEDWAWHAILPFAAYLVLLAAALVLGSLPGAAVVAVAIVVLSLLFIGIHNAWDVAVYLVIHGMPTAAAPDAGGGGPAEPVQTSAAPAAKTPAESAPAAPPAAEAGAPPAPARSD